MPHCFVVGCKSSNKRKQGLSFHQIPAKLRDEWLVAIGRNCQNIIVIQQRVCSKHFQDSDFDYVGARKHIKPNVIPSLNLPNDKSKTQFDLSPLKEISNCQLTLHPPNSKARTKLNFETEIDFLGDLSAVPSTPEFLYEELVGDTSTINLSFQSPLKEMPSSQSSCSDTEIRKKSKKKCKNLGTRCIRNLKRKSSRELLPSDTSDSSLQPSPTKRIHTPSSTASSTTSSVKRKLIKTFHNYSLSPGHYTKQIKKNELKALRFKSMYKNLKRTNIRRKKKIISLKQVVVEIKKKYALSLNAITALESCFNGIPLAVMKRMIANTKSKGKITKSQYPKELRSFAMTLQFYSSKAYDYVRRTFDFVLPAPSTIRAWFSKIDCSPGFTKPSLTALKTRAEEFLKKTGKQLICALMLDEMSVRKEIVCEKHSHNIWGYTDVGSESMVSNEQEPATEALVLMVVAINDTFKVPIAYFFINKINGEEKANIVNEALRYLHSTGIKILSLTCDGPQINFKMMKVLGCSVIDICNMKTYFLHPVDGSKVFVIFDICHMLKLVRNNWAASEVFLDPDGNEIKWQYITKLHELQDSEGLYLANKLRKKHIQWKKSVMKVNLAAQTLSSSVATALEFLCCDLEVEEFKDVLPTVQFINTFNKLFDILNSRNPWGKQMKTPLRQANEDYWRPFVEKALSYISNCKDLRGTLLHTTPKRVPFLGFVVSATSFLKMYDEEVKEKSSLQYILTYKCSQDHLELFFCSIRSRNGWNNNPNCLQFMHTYRRLLVHQDINSSTGNCISQDQTNVLTVSSTRNPLEITDINILRRREQNIEDLEQKIKIFAPINLNEFSENVVSYISGFVIKVVEKQIRCPTCIEALRYDGADEFDRTSRLINRKTRGGLIFPSQSVKEICTKTEKKIQITMKVHGNIPPSDIFMKLLLKESQMLLVNDHIFATLNDHVFDYTPEETFHKKKLIDAIVKSYASLRINSIARKINDDISGEKIRKIFNKLILFKHQ